MPETYLYPDGTDLLESGWTDQAGGTSNVHLSIDETGTPDDDTTYAKCNSSGGNRAFRVTLGPMVDMVACSAITLEIRVRDDSGGGAHVTMVMFLYIGGVEYNLTPTSQLMTGSYVDYSFTTSVAGINPATSLPFTQADLNALILGMRQNVNATSQGRVTRARIKVTYTPVSGDISVVRAIGSQRIRALRSPIMKATLEAPLWFLDNDLMDDFSLSHFELPDGSAPNLSLVAYRRRTFLWLEEQIDPIGMTVRVVARDRRLQFVNVWESMEAVRTSLQEDGNILLHQGGVPVFTRASDAWLEAPSSRLITRYGSNQKALVYGGLVVEATAKNYLKYSSCVSGATAVAALTETGAGGSKTQEAPTDPLFDSPVTGFCYLFVSGGGAAHRVTWPVSDTLSANTKFRVLIDHRDNATHVLSYRVVRTLDGFFWNDGSGAFQAGAVDNALAVSTSRTRHWSKVIDIGGTGTTVTVSVSQPAGPNTNRVHHLEVVDSVPITSRIVTDAATFTRAVATYAFPHTTTARAIQPAGGTFIGRLTPMVDSADITSGIVTLWEIVFDANNLIRLQWNAASSVVQLRITQAGNTTSALASVTWARDVEQIIAARWITAAGEFGLPALTQSVFVNGVKGTDVARAADPTELSGNLYVGGSSTVAASFKWRRCLWTPEILTDAEIARGVA